MSLSDNARLMLNHAVEVIQSEGHEIWGFISCEADEGLETFSSYTDEPEIILNNTLVALKAMCPDIDTPKPNTYEA
jgi:hypothetical protein